MKLFKILSLSLMLLTAHALLGKPYFMEPLSAHNYQPIVMDYLIKGSLSPESNAIVKQNAQKAAPLLITAAGVVEKQDWTGENADDVFNNASPGSVAVIQVVGPQMKYDYCGAPGMSTIGKWLKVADLNTNISAIVLNIDTPGGTVDGTFELADTIKAMNKPVIGFANGLCASAGYLIGCACNELYAPHASTTIGSIGVQVSFWNNKKAMEDRGWTLAVIRADQSKDKNEAFLQALEGNYEPIKVESLNPAAKLFIEHVNSMRSGKAPQPYIKGKSELEVAEPYTGKMYYADKAIEHGLIDGILSYDAVVARAKSLSNKKSTFKFSS